MTIKIGRASLRTPLDVQYVSRNTVDEGRLASGLASPAMVALGTEGYLVRGSEHGSTAQDLMDALVLERRRLGAIYVEDDSAVPAVPAGYYAIEDCTYEKPSGAPRRRPWRAQVMRVEAPLVYRQAESDNADGVDTADATADEGARVDYVTTGAYVGVLAPQAVAGAEYVNLPAGTYRLILRAWAVGTGTAQARAITRDLVPANITVGAEVTLATVGGWADYDLGTFTIPVANSGANWYALDVRDTVNVGSTVRLDRLIIAPA